MANLVLPFDSPEATLGVAGGKGANLSKLTRAGFPVPPGFIVSTAAYLAFVEANKLQGRIVELASKDLRLADEVSADIRQLFEEGGDIAPEVAAEILQSYRKLTQGTEEAPALAVRSSATAEDLPGASFAGQQDSYLNVRGERELLEAVKRCWSSLWTARALGYRARQGIDPATVSLAVVVQVLVPADAAGIMFTANPVTGARDEIVIDAAWGLGEAVVGGLVTPDHIVADKATGEIREVSVAEKAIMTVPVAAGTEERPVEAGRRRTRVLDDRQAAELAKLGAAIEESYGAPQDIEWCQADGRFFIVQARPITALPDEVRWESPLPGAKWLKDLQAAEWATEPLSPLGATTTFSTMVAARQRQLPMQRSPSSALVNGWLYMRADFQVLPFTVHLLRAVVRIRAGALDGHRRVRRTWPEQLTLLDSLEKADLATLPDDAVQAHAERSLEALGWWWWEVSWDAAVALFSEQLIRKLGVYELADPMVLFRGNESLLLEAERALRQAAQTGEVEAYLARFGHFMESADPIHPTLRESPELLAQYLAVARQSESSPDERLVRTRRERTEAERIVRALGGPRGFLARRLLGAGQSHAAHVDNAVFHFQRLLALVRAAFLELGQRLVRVGAAERAEDVFYLERGEVLARPGDLGERVAQRRQLRERQGRLAPPSFIPLLSDPAWDGDRIWKLMSSMVGATALRRGAQERNGQRILVGTPGAPGRARGTARVIAGPKDFNLFHSGDVLVTHATTPIWTPLFNIASAAVTEVGGPFSHASIVAREFGIPLVNGALDATQVIEDGMSIMVDGSAGIVELGAEKG